MSTNAIPKRSEVRVEDTWDLSDIFPSDEAWQAEYEAMKALPAQIAAFRGTLGRSASDLLAWYRKQDELSVRLTKLHGYANCHSDEDTANARYVDMKSRAMSVIVAIGQEPHAPVSFRCTRFCSSIDKNSMSPPSACNWGLKESRASFTLASSSSIKHSLCHCRALSAILSTALYYLRQNLFLHPPLFL